MSHVPPLSHTFEMLERIKGSTMSMSGIGIACGTFLWISRHSSATPPYTYSSLFRMIRNYGKTIFWTIFSDYFSEAVFFSDIFCRPHFGWLFFFGQFWVSFAQNCESEIWFHCCSGFLFFVLSQLFWSFFYFWIFSFCEIDGIWPTLRPPTPPLVSYI